MNGEISIRPSKDLRNNYARLSALAHTHPVAITVNGREDTVLMGHENYVSLQKEMAEMQERLALFAHLAQSQDDIRLGRVQRVDSVLEELTNDLDKL